MHNRQCFVEMGVAIAAVVLTGLWNGAVHAIEVSADIVSVSGAEVTPRARFWQKGDVVRVTRLRGDPPQADETTIADLRRKRILILHEPSKRCLVIEGRSARRELAKYRDPLFTVNCLLDTFDVAGKRQDDYEGFTCEVTEYRDPENVDRLVRSIGVETLLMSEGLTDDQREAIRGGDISMFEEGMGRERREAWYATRLERIVRHVIQRDGRTYAMEFRNIREEILDPALFEPRGYLQVDSFYRPIEGANPTVMTDGIVGEPPWLRVLELEPGDAQRLSILGGCVVKVTAMGVGEGGSSGRLQVTDRQGRRLAEETITLKAGETRSWPFDARQAVADVTVECSGGTVNAWVMQAPAVVHGGAPVSPRENAILNSALHEARLRRRGGRDRPLQRHQGWLCLRFTLNGEPAACRLKITGADGKTLAGGDFLGAFDLVVHAGTYAADLACLDLQGAPRKRVTDLTVEAGQRLARDFEWEAGFLAVSVTRNGEPIDAVVRIGVPGSDVFRPCPTWRTTWPVMLPPGTYRIGAMQRGNWQLLEQVEEVTVDAGKTAAVELQAPAE